jgi:hypothetical protein
MRVLNKRLWPIQFDLPVKDMHATDDRIIWLKQNLPREAWRFNENNSVYCFANKDDAVMFKLACS